MTDHPFVVGANVAIRVRTGYSSPDSFIFSKVVKVLPSGRFRIADHSGQWLATPPRSYEPYWQAHARGSHSGTLVIFDDTTSNMVANQICRAKRYKRFSDVKWRLDRTAFSERVTEDALLQLEAACAAISPQEER